MISFDWRSAGTVATIAFGEQNAKLGKLLLDRAQLVRHTFAVLTRVLGLRVPSLFDTLVHGVPDMLPPDYCASPGIEATILPGRRELA
jgi:hypothetical protein